MQAEKTLIQIIDNFNFYTQEEFYRELKNCKTGWNYILQTYVMRHDINLYILRSLLQFIRLNINAENAKSAALFIALLDEKPDVCKLFLEFQTVITSEIKTLLKEEKYKTYRKLFNQSTMIDKDVVSEFLQRLLASKSVEEEPEDPTGMRASIRDEIYTFATRHGLF